MAHTNNKALNTISNSAGRFFGLETHTEVINARLVNYGPSLITVHDRNSGKNRRISKDMVKSVRFQGRTVS